MKLLVLALTSVGLFGADSIPAWVREAAAQTVPAYPPKVAAVILLQEEHLTVDAAGRRVMRERVAIRVIQESRDSVKAYRTYNSKSGRIRDFQGWTIAPSGKTAALAKNRVVDQALSTDATYSEYRAKMLDPGSALAAGSVFAYEVIEEEQSVFSQYPFAFQASMPVLISRFLLTVPPGWNVKGKAMNAPGLETVVKGNTHQWEMRDLPWIEPEDYAPGISVLAPRLGVTYSPPLGAIGGMRPLQDWASVSEWLSNFVDPPAGVTPAIRNKTAEVIAGAKSEIDKIRAIASYAQQANYVSVQMNLTRGGGYTPNPAEQTLNRNYGDCKDKTTLMRAMLAAAGIESFATAIFWGERYYVDPEWPSPHPFNHMIVTVRVPAGTDLPLAFDHPRLGRLLPFDPTDPFTPVGDLPRDQQGSHALIIAGAKGELAAIPLAPPAANRIESVTVADYAADGSLNAKVVRHYFGQSAARLRAMSRSADSGEFRKAFEAALSRRLSGIVLGRVEPSDRKDDGRIQLEMDLSVRQFGQIMQGRLLVIAPGTLVPSLGYSFAPRDRRRPIELMGVARKDSIAINLPSAFQLDELPKPVNVEAEFGSYKAEWNFSDSKLTWNHELEVRDSLVPAASYSDVRRFFDAVTAAQASAVVLLKR